MLQIALLLPLLVCPVQDDAVAIRKYVSGESSTKPNLEGWTWQRVNKALAARIFSDKDGEQSHTVKQTDGYESTFYYYVPESYDPNKATALGIYLHGGVSSPQGKRGRGQWRAMKAQADKFGYTYGQLRFRAGRFFAQAYANKNDLGDSFIYGTGTPLIDNSLLISSQAQYDLSLLQDRERIVVGVDFERTTPDTEGTLYGRNEDNDTITELCTYVQSVTLCARR